MNTHEHCLVTGASGFIGQTLCRHLKDKNKVVRALGRKKFLGAYDELILADLLDLIPPKNSTSFKDPKSFKDPDSFSKSILQGIDTVFHLAGIAHTHAKSNEYEMLNVQATQSLVKMAEQCHVKNFIYFSSIKAAHPQDDYGHSKRKAEQFLLEFANQSQMKIIIVRPALVYGPLIKGNILQMIKAIKKGYFPPIPENGNRRSMVSVEDLVRASLMLKELMKKELIVKPMMKGLISKELKICNKIYTVTDGIAYSTRSLYDGIRKALNLRQSRFALSEKFLKIFLCHFLRKRSLYEKLLGSSFYSNEEISRLGFIPKDNFFTVLPSIIASHAKSTT